MLDLSNKDELALIEKMHKFNRETLSGNSFSYVVRNPDTGKPKFVPMSHRPCYGELRGYGETSTRPEDHRPGDLPKTMTESPGIREAVGVVIRSTSQDIDTHNALIEYLWSAESPWRRGLGFDADGNPGFEMTKNDEGRIVGAVMWETDVDPTVMISLFMSMRVYAGQYNGCRADRWKKYQEEYALDPARSLIMATWTQIHPDQTLNVAAIGTYTLPHKLNIPGWIAGKSNDLSNGGTWRGGEDYNRPEIANVFLDISDDAKPFSQFAMDIVGGGKIPVDKALPKLADALKLFQPA